MGVENVTQQAISKNHRFLLWRLPLLAATLLILTRTADSVSWAMVLALPLMTGMLAVYLFDDSRLQLWSSRGYLLIADALLVCLALLGTTGVKPALWIAYFLIVLLATLVGDMLKTLLATGALLGAMAAVASTGSVLGLAPAAGSLTYLLFLVCAALSFGGVGEQLSSQRQEVAKARLETSELWALLEIIDTVGSTLDVSQVMRSIVRLVGDLVETESCSILLVDEKLRNCFVVASKGHPEVDMLELDLEKYPEVQRALITREPVVIDDVENNQLVESVRDVLLAKGYRSLLVLPLLFGKEILGTMFLRARREKPFNPEELRFCKVAAGVSANALKNALLFSDVAQEAEEHRATGEKLRRVLDSTPDMIVATDTTGRVMEFNSGAEEMTGWSVDNACGEPLTKVLGSDESAISPLDESADGAAQDVMSCRADGEKVEISMVSASLSGPEGEIVGRVWIGRDVTKLRNVEKSLVHAERLSSLGEVVAGVAHELNNPLSGVVGYAELLRKHSGDQDQIRDLDRIVESALRCQKIVFKLLSFARKHPPEKKFQSLNECAAKVLDLKSYHLRSSQIETSLELDADIPSTCFDFHQIEQVVLNLLNNAEQAIAPMRSPGKIAIRTGLKDDFVFLEVQDNGPGVPPMIQDRIFDPFFTTKDLGKGTGLGLSVSYGIVEKLGGRMEHRLASSEGGACFTLYLPIVEGEEAEEHSTLPEMAEGESPLMGKRILVAEDELLVQELLAKVLTADGAHVTLAMDGEEAWNQLAMADYDLIVADLRMPNVDGKELYERVAEERPEMLRRFVFATGDLLREDSIAFLQDLPNRILTKPLELETVRRILSQVVASRPS
jgi:PAS domain S-box-containing protein